MQPITVIPYVSLDLPVDDEGRRGLAEIWGTARLAPRPPPPPSRDAAR